MPRRLRTLVGTIAILVFVCVYALVAIAVADSRIVDAPKLVQTLVYFLLGTIWVLPIMPLIKWMEGGRR
jgi:predicted membrane channel-forming protein YqfA (hemolysin III family)